MLIANVHELQPAHSRVTPSAEEYIPPLGCAALAAITPFQMNCRGLLPGSNFANRLQAEHRQRQSAPDTNVRQACHTAAAAVIRPPTSQLAPATQPNVPRAVALWYRPPLVLDP